MLFPREDRKVAEAAGDALEAAVGGAAAPDPATQLFVPLVLRHQDAELRFFSTLATFGTALDITVSELAIESFFPADATTAAALR